MRVLIFGASGSAGASILKVALRPPNVSDVIAIVRKPLSASNAKLRVVTHNDFLDFSPVASHFAGIDACFFALGVSSFQVREESEYRRITRDFAVAAAKTLKTRSPGACFNFISGASTDPNSKWMWARVKAQAEKDLTEMMDANCFRPGAIDGERSAAAAWYAPMLPLFKVFAPFRSMYISGDDLGRGMLQAAREGMRRRILENRDIRDCGDRSGR